MTYINSFISTLKRQHWLSLVFAVFLLTTLTACGGGGGDGGTSLSDDPAPTMPSRVIYVADSNGTYVNITNINSHGTQSITAYLYLEGYYIKASKQYSLTPSNIRRLYIRPTSDPGFVLPIRDPIDPFGGFDLFVDQSLTWIAGQHPTSGEFRIAWINNITVTVNNNIDGAGTPGVDITYSASSSSLSWPDFEAALNDDGAPAYQREAALAYLTFKYLYRPLYRVVENFDTMRTQEDAFEAGGSGTTFAVPLCSEFNGVTGNFNLTWFDGPGEFANAMGNGDNFTIAVDNCWLDDPASNDDLLYASGKLLLNSYGESTSPFSLGFVEVVFDNLEINQTAQTGPGAGTVVDDSFYTSTSDATTGRNGFYFELTPDVSSILNLANLQQTASATAISITMPSELGNFAVNLLSDVIADNNLTGTLPCQVSGTYYYSLNHLPFNDTAIMTVNFDNGDICIEGSSDQIAVKGSYTLTATAYTLPSTNNLAFNLAFNGISTQDAVGTRTINGQMHFSRLVDTNTSTSSEVSSSVSGQSLDMSESGITAKLSNFSFTGTRSQTNQLTLGAANETFALQLSTLTDSLTGTITSTFSGPEMTSLQAGSVRVTAPDTSNFLLTITGVSGAVTLDLDSDGNGSAEDTVNTTWSDLY
jgi:hypothetical protein